MSVMDAYVQQIDDVELRDLARCNLVESQARLVRAEIERRGLPRPLLDVLAEHVAKVNAERKAR